MEVKAVIARCQGASRDKRLAKKRRATSCDVQAKWYKYFEWKREASTLIRTKILKAGVLWMMEVNKKDKNGAMRFWERIRSQEKKAEEVQPSLITTEEKRVEGEEAQKYIRLTIEASFEEPDGMVIVSDNGLEGEYREMTVRHWDRIGRKVLMGTATGPDGMRMSLINLLG